MNVYWVHDENEQIDLLYPEAIEDGVSCVKEEALIVV